ncbi:MAG: LamG domain-containing protein, partial [Bacteroidota bacterium]|nr:LamG domain-containing protein [Bacteroidota bacterium]
SFDGTNHISTPFNPRTVIGDGNPFTVAFWTKPDQITFLRAPVGAFNISQSRRFYVAVYQGDWIWGYGNKNSADHFATRPAATADEWAHIGFVYDNTTGEVLFYLNGVKYTYDYAGVFGNEILPNFGVCVGARNTDSGIDSRFTGTVDEVLIWNEAKTSTDMLDLYNGTKP